MFAIYFCVWRWGDTPKILSSILWKFFFLPFLFSSLVGGGAAAALVPCYSVSFFTAFIWSRLVEKFMFCRRSRTIFISKPKRITIPRFVTPAFAASVCTCITSLFAPLFFSLSFVQFSIVRYFYIVYMRTKCFFFLFHCSCSWTGIFFVFSSIPHSFPFFHFIPVLCLLVPF